MSGLDAGKCQKQCKQICWYINKLSLLLITKDTFLAVLSLCFLHAWYLKKGGPPHPHVLILFTQLPVALPVKLKVASFAVQGEFDVTCFPHSWFVLLHNQIEALVFFQSYRAYEQGIWRPTLQRSCSWHESSTGGSGQLQFGELYERQKTTLRAYFDVFRCVFYCIADLCGYIIGLKIDGNSNRLISKFGDRIMWWARQNDTIMPTKNLQCQAIMLIS